LKFALDLALMLSPAIRQTAFDGSMPKSTSPCQSSGLTIIRQQLRVFF
jgi:hypothetical protein